MTIIDKDYRYSTGRLFCHRTADETKEWYNREYEKSPGYPSPWLATSAGNRPCLLLILKLAGNLLYSALPLSEK